MQDNQKQKKKQLNAYIQYSSFGLQMIVIITAGSLFGEYLDSKNNFTTPVFTIFLSLISIFLSLYYVLKNIKKTREKK